MCLSSSPKPPKLPPKPRPPTPAETTEKAEQTRRNRLVDAVDRNANILTSPLGASDFGENARKKRVTLGVG